VLVAALLAQLAVAAVPAQPVLIFPDAALDDTSAYRGYQTRFYRDAARNTLQVYIDQRSARVVHLFADADNASIGFTARTADGQTAVLNWDASAATVSARARTRTFEHRLSAQTNALTVGWFLLGSMRVERDFQFEERARGAFATAPYRIADVDRLIETVAALPRAVRARHLARLNAPTVAALRARMYPPLIVRRSGADWLARVRQVTLDGRDTLTLELRADTATVEASGAGDSLSLRSRKNTPVSFTVRVSTTAPTLTPLSRDQIFTSDFLAFLRATKARGDAGPRGDTADVRARRMERQVAGVELLVSREKLMAGLPTYATYFGRDMLMTALMMRPIWRHETLEAVIATALRKLASNGEVSHEEALGDQATRESAAEYVALMRRYRAVGERSERATADSLLASAERVLRTLRATRENYHMIDDEYQLPIVIARWITDPSVAAADKRAFLLAKSNGGVTRAAQIVRELALVAELTAAYAANPIAANLIAFAPREPTGWATASWRDSGAGYAGGRYAMDINAIWVPHALEATGQILAALRELGVTNVATPKAGSPLATYAADSALLRRAVTTWRSASRHFVVRQTAVQVRAATAARLAALPEEERAWWVSRPTTAAAVADSLTFLAVALDSGGAPIGVANTDPATQLFLGDGEGRRTPSTADERAATLRDVRLFVRPYPAGLFVNRIGPVVANDAYASNAIWDAFTKDPYHGPRVVWGREVNLFLLGVATRAAQASDTDAGYASELRSALTQIRTAVEQSGFHTELWSYGFQGGTLGALRYGSGGDIQLWSTTDLAVQYVLDRQK